MARWHLTKVDGNWCNNEESYDLQSTFKSKRQRAIPAAKPLDKQPWFVIARSAGSAVSPIFKKNLI